MNFFLALIISTLFVNNCASQNIVFAKDATESLHFSRIVVFDKDYKLPDLSPEDTIIRFTPSFDEIKIADKVIFNIYNSFPKKGTLDKKVKKYMLQYIGYINNRGENLLLMQFLKYKNTQELKKYYKNFENEFIIGSGSFFEENVTRYLVNISKNTIKLF